LLGKATLVAKPISCCSQSVLQYAAIRSADSVAARSAAAGSTAIHWRSTARRAALLDGAAIRAAVLNGAAVVVVGAAVAVATVTVTATRLAAPTQPAHQGPTVTGRSTTAGGRTVIAAMIAAIIGGAAAWAALFRAAAVGRAAVPARIVAADVAAHIIAADVTAAVVGAATRRITTIIGAAAAGRIATAAVQSSEETGVRAGSAGDDRDGDNKACPLHGYGLLAIPGVMTAQDYTVGWCVRPATATHRNMVHLQEGSA
jgi:hypothetical protein